MIIVLTVMLSSVMLLLMERPSKARHCFCLMTLIPLLLAGVCIKLIFTVHGVIGHDDCQRITNCMASFIRQLLPNPEGKFMIWGTYISKTKQKLIQELHQNCLNYRMSKKLKQFNKF